MASIIKLKRSTTASSVPSSGTLAAGELAVNLADKKLFSSSDGSNIITISGDQYNVITAASTNGADIILTVDNDALSNDTISFVGDDTITVGRVSGNGQITITADNTLVKTIDGDSGTATGSAHGMTIAGTANEIETAGSGSTITIGLPDDVTIGNDLNVTGSADVDTNLNVDGSTTLNGTTTTTLTSNGAVDFKSSLNVDGGTALNDVTAVDVSANGNLTVAGTITSTGAVTLQDDLAVQGDLSVDGNLTVEGALTYLSTSTVYADDGMFKLGANNAADTIDTGVYALYIDGVTSEYSGYFRDASDGIFKFYTGLQVEPTSTVDTNGAGYALAQVDAIIDGGTY